MTFPVTEHTVKTAAPHHGLSRLRCGRRTAADLLPRLAGALAVVAAPVAGLRRARLPLRRARHARLRPVEHLRAPRGLRAGADRRRHARAARLARPRARRCGSATTGAARSCGTWPRITPTGRSASRASACRICRRASRSTRSCRWSTARSIPRPSIRPASGTISSSTRRASTRRCTGFEANIRNTVKALFRKGNPDGVGKPVAHRGGAQGRRLAGRRRLARPAARCRRADRGRHGGLYRGADAQRLLRARLLVHEPQAPTAPTPSARRTAASSRCRCCSCTALYDQTCETVHSRLAEPMRRDCADLTEVVVKSGHWMAQEKPVDVNVALSRWLATKLPDYWKRP